MSASPHFPQVRQRVCILGSTGSVGANTLDVMSRHRDRYEVFALSAYSRVDTLLALGNPPNEIVKIAAKSGCDLIALASHGHKLIGDLIHGSTIDKVRHNTTIPLLVVNAMVKSATALHLHVGV